jgi:hypothetical protein
MFRSTIKRFAPAAITVASGAYVASRFINNETFTPSTFAFVPQVHAEEKVPYVGLPNTRYERTFLMVCV